MSTLVIDGSAALSLALPDESSELAQRVADALVQGVPAFVPTHWSLEVTNGILMAERRQRISPADAAAAINVLRQLPVAAEGATSRRAFAEIPGIARQYGLTSYDAAYLELAMRRGAMLATLDQPLGKAAAAAGVPLL